MPVLGAAGLATEHPVVVPRSPKDGILVEILGWVADRAAWAEQRKDRVDAVWKALGEVAAGLTFADLPEACGRLPHATSV